MAIEVKYLSKMVSNANKGGYACEGYTEYEIKQLEENYNEGKQFPQAFREFLFIGGKYDNTGTNNLDIDNLQTFAKKNLKYTNNEIKHPFFVFNGIDACAVFDFIYLNEIEDNPQVYTASPSYTEFGDPLIEMHPLKFVQLVEANIKSSNED